MRHISFAIIVDVSFLRVQPRERENANRKPAARCCLCERKLSYPHPTLALEAHLESLTAEQPRPKLTAGFDEAAVKLTALHKHVADSAHFLPAFDARQAQEVKSLTAGQPPFSCRRTNRKEGGGEWSFPLKSI